MKAVAVPGMVLALGLALGPPTSADAVGPSTIDFESFSGPPFFDTANSPLIAGGATFTGGQLLTAATNLPANQSTVYGTAFFCNGCEPTIEIEFDAPVARLRMQVMNGRPLTLTYTVLTDRRRSVTRTLAGNTDSGSSVFVIRGARITHVSVSETSGFPEWDFLIDDLSFVQLPDSSRR